MTEKIKLGQDVEVTSSSPNDLRIDKKWGYITAYPHEYLIHFRHGKFSEKTSGQGASCFKYPTDTVFIIPTSLKEIVFEANQLSVDNVDLRIRGIAVYRIKNPLQIYTLLNFSNRQQAEEKLARMIGDLCRSTSKWLVANMKLEECMRKRKEEIAGSLKKEVSLIVADDEKGWGVEIVTIDIQDIYIQDAEIFDAIQATFKADKIRESKLVHIEISRTLEVKKLETERDLAEHRKDNELEKSRIEAQIKAEQIRLARQNEEQQFKLDHYRIEQNESMANYKLEQDIARDKQKNCLKLEIAQQNLENQRVANQERLAVLAQQIEIENHATPASLQKNFIEHALPEIAQALAKNMNNARISIIQQEGQNAGTPFRFILTELVDILRERLATLGTQVGETEHKK